MCAGVASLCGGRSTPRTGQYAYECVSANLHSMMPMLSGIDVSIPCQVEDNGTCSVTTKEGLGNTQQHTWISGATVGANIVAGHALHEVLEGTLIARLLTLAHESGHDAAVSGLRVVLILPVRMLCLDRGYIQAPRERTRPAGGSR